MGQVRCWVPSLNLAGQIAHVCTRVFQKCRPQELKTHGRRAEKWSGVCKINCGLDIRFFGEICGSPIRPNGRRKLGSRSPRTRCGIARLQLFLFVASCLSSWFASPVNATPSGETPKWEFRSLRRGNANGERVVTPRQIRIVRVTIGLSFICILPALDKLVRTSCRLDGAGAKTR